MTENEFKAAWSDYANVKMQINDYLQGRKETGLLLMGQPRLPMLSDAMFIAEKLLEAGSVSNHPDFHLVSTPEGKSTLGVEDAGQIIELAERMPAIGNKLVVVVDGMDKFNVTAQNKLLKLIEEAKNMVVIGICYGGEVLPTIKSRMQAIEYRPMTKADYRELGDEKLYYISGGAMIDESIVSELVPVFDGVGNAVRSKDMKLLLSTLHLVAEKDKNSFYANYREYIPGLFAYIAFSAKGCDDYENVMASVRRADRKCRRVTYTKDDFFNDVVSLF